MLGFAKRYIRQLYVIIWQIVLETFMTTMYSICSVLENINIVILIMLQVDCVRCAISRRASVKCMAIQWNVKHSCAEIYGLVISHRKYSLRQILCMNWKDLSKNTDTFFYSLQLLANILKMDKNRFYNYVI